MLGKNFIMLIVFGLLISCSHSIRDNYEKRVELPVEAKSQSKVDGSIELLQNKNKLVVINAKVKGLRPNSEHGFHIHEKGDCSADDASSAGGHYAPNNNPHGDPSKDPHHFGDLGNIRANEKGVAEVTVTLKNATLTKGDRYSLLGRSIVIHANEDDLSSQPSGDAGKRIGCVVIADRRTRAGIRF